jgi:hypothetical protein
MGVCIRLNWGTPYGTSTSRMARDNLSQRQHMVTIRNVSSDEDPITKESVYWLRLVNVPTTHIPSIFLLQTPGATMSPNSTARPNTDSGILQ